MINQWEVRKTSLLKCSFVTPKLNAQSSSESPIVRMQQCGMSKVFSSFPLSLEMAITSLSHTAHPKIHRK